MALCDYLITADINGLDCSAMPAIGAESMGLLYNRAELGKGIIQSGFDITFQDTRTCDSKAWKIYQSGKQPFNGTQQEMVEGTYQNTITNTVQFVVLKQNEDFAQQLFALVNGEFVAIIPNKNGTYQVYGAETGLRCTGAVRELYSDDTLSGWLITFTEEGATRGSLFVSDVEFTALQSEEGCEP